MSAYAFQYYKNHGEMVADQEGLTLSEAVSLARSYEQSLTRAVERGRKGHEMCLWESSDDTTYANVLWHVSSDELFFRFGRLCQAVPCYPITSQITLDKL